MKPNDVKRPGWYRWTDSNGNHEIVKVVDRGGDLFVYATHGGNAVTKWLSTYAGTFLGPIDLARLCNGDLERDSKHSDGCPAIFGTSQSSTDCAFWCRQRQQP